MFYDSFFYDSFFFNCNYYMITKETEKETDTETDTEISVNINNSIWSPEQEKLLAEWSEKAQCYRWMHSHAERKFRKGNFAFTIPIIIMSTLTGTANFGVNSYVPEEHQKMAQMAIGCVNIVAGILSTLQNFLRYAENNEAHRSASICWSKFGRNIRIELSLARCRRKNASDFLKVYRAEYDRLIEQSPLIPEKTIELFKKKFKKVNNFHKPDVCNGLEKCEIHCDSDDDIGDIILDYDNAVETPTIAIEKQEINTIVNDFYNKKQKQKQKSMIENL